MNQGQLISGVQSKLPIEASLDCLMAINTLIVKAAEHGEMN